MTAYVGWIRVVPRGRWWAATAAETRDECWRRLLKIPAAAGGRDERMVCERGRHPNGQGPGH